MIQFMKLIADLTVNCRSCLGTCFRDLIPGRVQDHAGMVIVFCDHLHGHFFPTFLKMQREVIGILVQRPHIAQFIHDQDSVTVTCI